MAEVFFYDSEERGAILTRTTMDFDQACEVFASRQRDEYDEASQVVIAATKVGLTIERTAELARSIAHSGNIYSLPLELRPYADVASTGGPASLSTLLCPLLIAAQGIRVPKLSATGSIAGGIDTFAMIPSFKVALNPFEFNECLRRALFAHVQPGKDVCEADHHLINLRREQRMMANPYLAAASLLGKKLAVPGTAAVFDFRVGPTGNAGVNLEAALKGAEIFIGAARLLGIKVSLILTDNRSFPCSVLGRLEALALLSSIVNGERPKLELDVNHLKTCITLSSTACALALGRIDISQQEFELSRLLEKGLVHECLIRHLEAQGSSAGELERVLRAREGQNCIALKAPRNGYWHPPGLDITKEWIKTTQTMIEKGTRDKSFNSQVGLRLLVDPGKEVSEGEAVVEVRHPHGVRMAPIPEALTGTVEDLPWESNSAILAIPE